MVFEVTSKKELEYSQTRRDQIRTEKAKVVINPEYGWLCVELLKVRSICSGLVKGKNKKAEQVPML